MFQVQINHNLENYDNDFYLASNMINPIILWATVTGIDNFFGKKNLI